MKCVHIEPVYELLAAATAQDLRREFLTRNPDSKLAHITDEGRHEYVVSRFDLMLGNSSETRFIFNEKDRIIGVSWQASFGGSEDGRTAFFELSELVQEGFKRTYSEQAFPANGSMGEKRIRTFRPARYELVRLETRHPQSKYPLRHLAAHRWFRQPEAAGLPPPPPTHLSLEDLYL